MMQKPGYTPISEKKSDIKLIAASLPSCTFRHISRGLNGAAHLLARYCENSVF
jgi:hypothetical protein